MVSTRKSTRAAVTDACKTLQRYARRRKGEKEAAADADATKEGAQEGKQEIFVLEGGFTEFQRAFKVRGRGGGLNYRSFVLIYFRLIRCLGVRMIRSW